MQFSLAITTEATPDYDVARQWSMVRARQRETSCLRADVSTALDQNKRFTGGVAGQLGTVASDKGVVNLAIINKKRPSPQAAELWPCALNLSAALRQASLQLCFSKNCQVYP